VTDRPTPSCSSSELLQRSGLDGASEAAARLDARVEGWLSQRLWSINLAPELVLHDDRHVSSVDRLAARMAEPLLDREVLSVVDIEALSCAAWLHDWGHIGGPIGRDVHGREVMVTSPQAVRKYHGLITQQLIRPEWAGMHGIDDEATCARAGLLCGHHQGWTSFGSHRPDSKTVSYGTFGRAQFQPRSLDEDLALDHVPSDLTPGKAQLLVALLRVADGADLGGHRIPDRGRPKASFLAHCIRMQAWRAKDELLGEAARKGDGDKVLERKDRVLDQVIEMSRRYAMARHDMDVGRSVSSEMREVLGRFPDSEVLGGLSDYIEFTDDQAAFYERHGRVARVDLVDENPPGPGPRVINVIVSVARPPESEDPADFSQDDLDDFTQLAVDSVAEDIRKELASGSKDGDRSVGEVLESCGLSFGRCFAAGDRAIWARLG
jgi:hypothetical protein